MDMKHDVRAEGDARSRARTFWDEYKWLILLTAVTFFMVLLAARGCSEDPYRAAVIDATTKCVDESGCWSEPGYPGPRSGRGSIGTIQRRCTRR